MFLPDATKERSNCETGICVRECQRIGPTGSFLEVPIINMSKTYFSNLLKRKHS